MESVNWDETLKNYLLGRRDGYDTGWWTADACFRDIVEKLEAETEELKQIIRDLADLE